MTSSYDTNTRALFIDIDGVLADISHRLHYIQSEPKNYDLFYGAEMASDKPMEQNIQWVSELARTSATVAFITGRPERTREVTRLWLQEHAIDIIMKNFKYDPEPPPINIYMRKDGDHRPSESVKAELVKQAYQQHLDHWVYTNDTTVLILDDQVLNLKLMRDSLITMNKNAPKVTTMLVGLGCLFPNT